MSFLGKNAVVLLLALLLALSGYVAYAAHQAHEEARSAAWNATQAVSHAQQTYNLGNSELHALKQQLTLVQSACSSPTNAATSASAQRLTHVSLTYVMGLVEDIALKLRVDPSRAQRSTEEAFRAQGLPPGWRWRKGSRAARQGRQ